jgi:hypothetical protein
MRKAALLAQLSTILFAALTATAQSTFQNLDFEQARPVTAADPNNPYAVTAASAVPCWTVYQTVDTAGDVIQATEVLYGTITTGGTSLTLIGPATQYAPPAVDGNYSVFLQTYAPNNWVSISQTGLIPVGTQSLLFQGRGGEIPYLNVQLGTQAIPFSAVGSGANDTLFAANISPWAGDTEKITFTGYSSGYPDSWELDNIAFSPNAVPEPCTLALLLTGGAVLGLRSRRVR